jgi:hypothetical protein
MTDQKQTEVRNLQMRQTWIAEQIESIKNSYNYETLGEAFQALVISLLFDLDYESIQPEEIVDGGQDKQIDIIRIDDDDEQGYAHIHIVQAKNTEGFSSNTLIEMRNGLSWVFERPKSEYQGLENTAFVNKIDEIRDLRLRYGAANISVSVYFVTVGDTSTLSDEFLQEKKILLDTYSNVGFNDFNFRELGAFEVIEIMNESERVERCVDIDIPIVYDVNRPSLLQYRSGDTKALICTVTGRTLAQVTSTEPQDAIFDLNVRPYYGPRGKVNRDILVTCTTEESTRFWFLNNGVTMICDNFDWTGDPDKPMVKVYNAQIVNGCQTSVTLRQAWKNNELKDDVHLLLRIYATDNLNLAERITLTTNNQNRITDRDLRANDSIQIDIQKIMKERFEYYYERKNKQFQSMRGSQKQQIVPNSKAAQAYLAIVRRKPSIARGFLGKIWSDHYEEIFGNATVGDLLASYLIYRYCYGQARSARKNSSLARTQSEVAVYGLFHIARICGYLLLNDEWGNKYEQAVREFINQLDDDTSILAQAYDNASRILIEIREQSMSKYPNPTLYFKAGEVQKSLELTIDSIKGQ